MAGRVTGRAAMEGVYRTWFKAFPDLKFEFQQLLIDGDHVAHIGVADGSDTGGFMGLPPTGRSMRFPFVMLHTMKGDKIGTLRTVYDFTGVLIQLGVLKAKAM
jgi:predicted ester cyclase